MHPPNTPSAFKLLDGTSIPWLAWGNGSGQAQRDPIESGKLALEAGIRHIDTAQLYRTETETGIAIQKSSIPRESVYVTSKLSAKDDDEPVPLDQVRSSVQGSLDRLGFVPDLYLIHNPFVAVPGELKAMWKILEDLKDEGKLKSIGVSNFRPQDLNEILDGARYKPVVNQLEYHPFTLAHLAPLLAIQAEHGIITESYGSLSPLLRHPTGGGPLKPILEHIAKRLSNLSGEETVDSTNVLFLWLKAKGVVAVTSSGNPQRIKALADISRSTLNLEQSEVEEIDTVGKSIHFRHYSEHMEVDFPVPNLPNQ